MNVHKHVGFMKAFMYTFLREMNTMKAFEVYTHTNVYVRLHSFLFLKIRGLYTRKPYKVFISRRKPYIKPYIKPTFKCTCFVLHYLYNKVQVNLLQVIYTMPGLGGF